MLHTIPNKKDKQQSIVRIIVTANGPSTSAQKTAKKQNNILALKQMMAKMIKQKRIKNCGLQFSPRHRGDKQNPNWQIIPTKSKTPTVICKTLSAVKNAEKYEESEVIVVAVAVAVVAITVLVLVVSPWQLPAGFVQDRSARHVVSNDPI